MEDWVKYGSMPAWKAQNPEQVMFSSDPYNSELADSYKRRALGIGNVPPAGQEQLVAGLERLRSAGYSQAAGARGMPAGVAARMAMQNEGDVNIYGNQQQELLEAQDRQAAMEQWLAYEQLRSQKDAFRQQMMLGKYNIDRGVERGDKEARMAAISAGFGAAGGIMGGMGK